MSDLAQGSHANVFLQPGQVCRVAAAGVVRVTMLWGGPAGVTDVAANTRDFGPYGVPAKLRVDAMAGPAGYQIPGADAMAELVEDEVARQMTAWAATVDQVVTPASGATVQMTDTSGNGFLRIRGSTPLASLAIAHPTDANSVNSQVRSVYFEVDVAVVTWPGSTADNLPSSAAMGDSCTTQRLEPHLWARRY